MLYHLYEEMNQTVNNSSNSWVFGRRQKFLPFRITSTHFEQAVKLSLCGRALKHKKPEIEIEIECSDETKGARVLRC